MRSTLGTRSLIWVVGVSPVIARLLAPRAIFSSHILIDAPPLSGFALLAAQAMTLTGLALSVLIIVSQHSATTTEPQRLGGGLVTAVLAIYASITVSAIFGGHGGFDRHLFVLPIVIIALYLAPRLSALELISQLRWIFRIYIYGSLSALIIAPTWAFSVAATLDSRDYFNIGGQLSGLTPDPNALGAIAATALIVEFAAVGRKRIWPMHVAATITVLLLAQSRAGVVAAVLGLVFLGASYRSLRLMRWIGTCALAAATVALVLSPRIARLAANTFSSRDIQTLNGRTNVWTYAYDQFLANPLTGFGPNLFDPTGPEAAVGAFPTWAGHAHNQIFQMLGEAGIIGMVALIAFILVGIAASAKRSGVLAGLSSAMLAIMLALFVTDTPLRDTGGFDSAFALLFFLIAVLITPLDEASHEAGLGVSTGLLTEQRAHRPGLGSSRLKGP